MKRTVVAHEFRSLWYGTPLLTVLESERDRAVSFIYNLGYTTGDLGGSIELVPISAAEARKAGRRRGARR